MKNQAPIKRHPAIVSFSKDHHFGLLLVWKIRQGLGKSVDPVRISNYVSFYFKEDLEKHFKEEEQLLFCELPVNDVLRKQAEADHQEILKLVRAVTEKKDDTGLLNQLADMLEKHIRFEERVLFNYFQDKFSEDEMSVLAAKYGQKPIDITADWQDKFWITKK